MRRIVTLALALVSSTAVASDAPRLTSRVVRVAAWKNGLAAVTREVQMPDRPGRYAVDMPSAPLHGTVWAALPPKAHLTEIGVEAGMKAPREGGLLEIACAAIGKEVVVERGGAGDHQPPLRGRLVHAPCDGRTDIELRSTNYYQQPMGMLQLETEDGALAAVGFHVVTGLIVQGARYQDERPSVIVDLDAVSGRTFELTWLTRGIAWAPAARLELESPVRATLNTSATLVNEAEDLDGVTFDLVSGPATFTMANVDSPLAGAGLANFLQALAGRSGYNMAQYPLQNAADSSVAAEQSIRIDAGSGTELAREDASIRRLEGVSLKRGATSWRPLWSESIAVEHVHRWRVPSALQDRNYAPSAPAAGPQHVVRLTNATQNPWTSQPVEIVSGGAVVGQSKVAYTPSGATADIVIADALDLKAEDTETETGRTNPGSQPYRTRVSLSGDLTLENLTGGDVKLEVTKEIEGDLVSSTPEASARKVGKGAKPLNPRQVLTWTLPLKAGASVTLSYAYQTWM